MTYTIFHVLSIIAFLISATFALPTNGSLIEQRSTSYTSCRLDEKVVAMTFGQSLLSGRYLSSYLEIALTLLRQMMVLTSSIYLSIPFIRMTQALM